MKCQLSYEDETVAINIVIKAPQTKAEFDSILQRVLDALEFTPPNVQYTLVLESFKHEAKIKCIKAVRAVTGLGLKEAKDFVENPLPKKLDIKGSREQMRTLSEYFYGIGTVRVAEVSE